MIQNENELLRYSYADVRHLLARQNYEWSYYTSENISGLSTTLSRYNAIIIATNACNDRKILDWLTDHKSAINSHLVTAGAGLLVGFQMALSDRRGQGQPFPFLDDSMQMLGRYRFTTGEQANSGILGAGEAFVSSSIMHIPNEIDLAQLTEHSRHNPNVPGIYWGYLDGFDPQAYETIVVDADNPTRALLAVSRAGKARTVVSALVIDWQRSDTLWENVTRYVVEGERPVVIVGKSGERSLSLDLLRHQLRERRIPHITQIVHSESIARLEPREYFSAYVLDGKWTKPEVSRIVRRIVSDRPEVAQVYYFDRPTDDVVASSCITAQSDYQVIVDVAVQWLRSQHHENLWENSLTFSTFYTNSAKISRCTKCPSWMALNTG